MKSESPEAPSLLTHTPESDLIHIPDEKLKYTKLSRELEQEEFNNIAKFIAVAEELSQEPFFSPDNHLRFFPKYHEAPKGFAEFGHPAFLKSAILPFRKLWMSTEPCAYWRIRNLIYELLPKSQKLQGLRYWYYDNCKRSLENIVFKEGKIRTANELLDLWINTQSAHTGKRAKGNGDVIGNYEISDFNDAINLHGRARLEYEFRLALIIVGHIYTSFYKDVALPLFSRLKDEGYEPSFEVGIALDHGFYPRATDQIRITDFFWHLDKETEEETFDRLLKREDYGNMDSLFCGYFFDRRTALNAVIQFETLDLLVTQTGGAIISKASDDDKLMSNFCAKGDFNYNGGRVTVYENRRILFEDRSHLFIQNQYKNFREAYLKHRYTIISRTDKWKGNWHGI